MGSEFPGFAGPSASTEAPLEMLAACHIRIRRQCETLVRLAKHLSEKPTDDDARAAASRVLRYFDTSAQDHHADEEQDLFPALLTAMAGSDAVCIRALTERLEAEHRLLEADWRRLRPLLEAIAEGKNVPLPIELVASYSDAYARHMQMEEDELLPMAARLLSDADIAAIGRAMRTRRGIPDDY